MTATYTVLTGPTRGTVETAPGRTVCLQLTTSGECYVKLVLCYVKLVLHYTS